MMADPDLQDLWSVTAMTHHQIQKMSSSSSIYGCERYAYEQQAADTHLMAAYPPTKLPTLRFTTLDVLLQWR